MNQTFIAIVVIGNAMIGGEVLLTWVGERLPPIDW
jgi:hypothetical protein